MKRLILHIGDHKTGTSTLQRALSGGAAGDAVLYPRAGRAQGAGHHNLAWQSGSDKRFKPALGGWSDVAVECAGADAPTIILSAEAFEFQDPDLVVASLHSAFAGIIDRVDIIAYVRDHQGRILSSFAERVRRGIGPFDLDDWIEQGLAEERFTYAARLRRWQAAAGALYLAEQPMAAQFIPVIYDKRRLEDGDIATDFLVRMLGLNHEQGEAPPVNAAPGARALTLICMVNAALSEHLRPAAARLLAPRISAAALRACQDSDRPLVLTPLQRSRLETRLSDDAAAVDRFFGDNDAGHFTACLASGDRCEARLAGKPDAALVISMLAHVLAGEDTGSGSNAQPRSASPSRAGIAAASKSPAPKAPHSEGNSHDIPEAGPGLHRLSGL